jgi:hypothetical protein
MRPGPSIEADTVTYGSAPLLCLALTPYAALPKSQVPRKNKSVSGTGAAPITARGSHYGQRME